MLARSLLPAEWVVWNGMSGAPYHGPYAHLPFNSHTRVWEYPWAFHAVSLEAGMVVADIGGGMSGFSISLASTGADVTVVDPNLDGTPTGQVFNDWCSRWGVSVQVRRSRMEPNTLSSASYDVIYCLSVVEHILQPLQRAALIRGCYAALKPGGKFVVTLDLHLEIVPFTKRENLPNLVNVPVSEFLEQAPFELRVGEPREIYGHAEFDEQIVLRGARDGWLLVTPTQVTSQCFVLAKPL